MYVSITGVENNKDVYINQSYRKENGKTSSRIYRKLGKLNELLRQFDDDFDAMMAWAKSEAEKTQPNTMPEPAMCRFLFPEKLTYL